MRSFSKYDTLLVKGVAILLLLFHHLFYTADRYQLVSFHFFNAKGVPYCSIAAQQARLCVAIFLILSGYGMYEKLSKHSDLLTEIKLSFSSLKKVMLGFWSVFIIFVPLSLFLGRSITGVYSTAPVLGLFFDFFGLTYLTDTGSMNAAWWYLTIIVFAYPLCPFIKRGLKHSHLTVLALICLVLWTRTYLYPFVGIGKVLFYLAFFAFGMWLSASKILAKMISYLHQEPIIIRFVILALLITAFYFLRLKADILIDCLGTILIMLLAACVFSYWKPIAAALAFLGKYSGTMYFAHSFFYSRFFLFDFIYGLKNPLLIYLMLLSLSLFSALFIDNIKNFISSISKKYSKS